MPKNCTPMIERDSSRYEDVDELFMKLATGKPVWTGPFSVTCEEEAKCEKPDNDVVAEPEKLEEGIKPEPLVEVPLEPEAMTVIMKGSPPLPIEDNTTEKSIDYLKIDPKFLLFIAILLILLYIW